MWAVSAHRVESEIAAELPEGRLRMLLPIHLKNTCVMRHDTDEQVMDDVKAAIVSNYPDDQDTGFAEGALGTF